MFSGTDHRGESDDDAFANELLQLKRRGSSVLVVGSVRNELRLATSRRLLGAATDCVRRRVEVTTTGAPSDSCRLEGSPDPIKRITYDAQSRSAAAQSSTQQPGHLPTPGRENDEQPVEETTLSGLSMAISSAIDAFDSEVGGLDASELRVGVNSLLPLLEDYDEERVFRFIHLINGHTRGVNGMIHYHLPVERNAEVVSLLSPLFDIVLELREQHGTCQQRWSLNDGAHRSGWLPLDEV